MAGSQATSELSSPDWRRRFYCTGLLIGWLAAFCICASVEFQRLSAAIDSAAGPLGWFANWNLDTTLPFLSLLVLPFLLGVRRWIGLKKHPLTASKRTHTDSALKSNRTSIGSLLTSSGLSLLSLMVSASIGLRNVDLQSSEGLFPQTTGVPFFTLPPAYHDEFSYQLQARTFLARRIAFPPMAVRPDLFHQIHVLNQPTTASRYFPLTGLWMAPFEYMGEPYFGHWIAGALACFFFHRSLLQIVEARWALAGGFMIAVCPGLAVFSNLLLAHHPTMLALSIFLWAFLRLMISGSRRHAFIAGIALSLAMLGRPVTAAGFALPFGIWLVSRICRSLRQRESSASVVYSWKLLPAMGLPIIAGFGILAMMNQEITGSWRKSAYQLYTDTWTPRHRFGFNNAEIGAKLAGPDTLEAYDRWAENLTIDRAIENEKNRLIASSQWTLGIPGLLLLLLSAVPSCFFDPSRSRVTLLFCSIFSLHAVHIPYWYDGILHWHYVFETAPLLLMLCAVGLNNVAEVLQAWLSRREIRVWCSILVVSCLLPSWVDANTLWGTSRVSGAVSEQSFSRVRFEQFNRLTHSKDVHRPCLVLVDETGHDVQLSYIVNSPDLRDDVIICRKPESASEITELTTQFSGRTVYEFSPGTFQLTEYSQ